MTKPEVIRPSAIQDTDGNIFVPRRRYYRPANDRELDTLKGQFSSPRTQVEDIDPGVEEGDISEEPAAEETSSWRCSFGCEEPTLTADDLIVGSKLRDRLFGHSKATWRSIRSAVEATYADAPAEAPVDPNTQRARSYAVCEEMFADYRASQQQPR